MAIRRTGSQTLVNRGVTAAAATPVNIVTGTGGPTVNISSIQIANSTFVAKDDLAIDTAGGYMIINGTGFKSGAVVYIQGTAATSTSFVSSSRLNVTVPALSSGLLDVYVVNTDGSGSIYLQSLRANGVPSWTTTSPLTTQDTGVTFAINLVASGAAGDGTITYAVSSGSTLPSGTFLVSNGYFYGTISGLTEETTYSFSVDAIDAQNQETARSFNITVRAGDQYLKNTVLLLNGETSNNTWITDTSTNNFAITVNGDTRPVGFSPYETVWSNFFDGNGDSLSLSAATALSLGTGDFTMEAWIYPTSINSTFWPIIECRSTGSSIPYAFGLRLSGGNLRGTLFDGGDRIGSINIPYNSWTHLVFTREGTTLRSFVNGVLDVNTAGYSTNLNISGTQYIGALVDPLYSVGYISNLRIVKGTAVYTSAFTPPTSPLTAIANTSLLTCQSNRLIDNSTNNFTITKNGDVTVSNFGPFVETDITTGSGYFDGTGDFLNLPNINFASNNFTIEGWFYPTTIANLTNFWGTDNGAQANPKMIMYIDSSGNLTVDMGNAGTTQFPLSASASTHLRVNAWNHIAVVRSGTGANQFILYINGVSRSTGQLGTNISTITAGFNIGYIGESYGQLFSGYISNFRIVNGTAVYTTNFTPPTSPLTPIANTSLLTLQSRIGENNNRFIDVSGINNIITRSGNTSQGTFSPFQRGGWSNYFDGVTDFLTTPSSSLVAPTGNFTIEAWVYPNTFTSSNSGGTGIVFIGNSTSNDGRLQLWTGTDGSIVLYLRNNSASDVTTVSGPAGSIILNSWNHIAGVRNGNNYTLYVNGTSVGNTTSATVMTYASNVLNIGFMRQSNFLHYWNGYISNLRLVNGTALYTSNFTTPTLPLTAVANTALLTCADNAFIDDSPNNFTITRNGDVSVQSFSPFKTYTYTANTHSVYFDGTGDYLTVPSNAALDLPGDFTIEFWLNLSNVVSTWQTIISRAYNIAGGWRLYKTQTDPELRWYAGGTSTILTTSSGIANNAWSHVAVVRQGSTLTTYVNGTSRGSATNSTNYTPGDYALEIGSGVVTSSFPMTGYISNLRIVKGTAVYTSNFTPPTLPLTVIANTNLLTCSSNTIVDLSTANTGNVAHTITVNGDARPTTVNPLGFTVTNLAGTSAEYSITDEGGSMYFDGTGDFLTIPSNVALSFGTAPLTVECWIYPTSTAAANKMILNRWSGSNADSYQLFLRSNNRICWQVFTQNSADVAALDIPINSWTHIAWTRVGTSGYLYVNGILRDTATFSNSSNGNGVATVGADQSGTAPFFGYISGLRVTRGVSRYTSNFIPPSTPLTPVANTTLLLNGTNSSIVDYTRKNNLETIGDIKIRNNIKKFGNTSMFFDGTGDYLLSPTSPQLDFGTGDFTIECWVYFNALSTSRMIVDRYASANGGSYQLYWRSTGTSIAFWAGTSVILQDSNTTRISTGQWYHIAVTRSGTTARLFIDGTQVASTTNSTNLSSTLPLCVGREFTSASADLNGYIDDLRITKGVARYTSNFSVPSSQFLTS